MILTDPIKSEDSFGGKATAFPHSWLVKVHSAIPPAPFLSSLAEVWKELCTEFRSHDLKYFSGNKARNIPSKVTIIYCIRWSPWISHNFLLEPSHAENVRAWVMALQYSPLNSKWNLIPLPARVCPTRTEKVLGSLVQGMQSSTLCTAC